MKRICVYCGSNPGRLPVFREAARQLGRVLAERGHGLVYGGASVGVMGAVADAVLEHGGEAIGVIPRSLATREVAHDALDQLIVVESMHQRKARMAELSDGFIALPGGWGTIEEIFEMLTWAQLGFHEKPCGLLNVASYYDHLFKFLEQAIAEKFVREEYRPMIMMEQSAVTLLDRFSSYRAPKVKKWLGPEET
ncbi:MAG: TIGR00730 family Rossman fold protein [Gammaproteobacteria bacterium]|nr:TIGR00730 family Rossman fold protein [Gammaproteobacteria bacterium]